MKAKDIEEVLRTKGMYVCTTSGCSMVPMLRNRRDQVIIRPVTGRLKKYDVPLYRRGKEYVLHRVIKVEPDSYVICGDNNMQKEYGIKDDQVIGVLSEFYRNGRKVNLNGVPYILYSRIWVAIYPLRRAARALRKKLGKVKRSLKRQNTP